MRTDDPGGLDRGTVLRHGARPMPGSVFTPGTVDFAPLGQQVFDSINVMVVNPLFQDFLGTVVNVNDIPAWSTTWDAGATVEVTADAAYPGGAKVGLTPGVLGDEMELVTEDAVPITPYGWYRPFIVWGYTNGSATSKVQFQMTADWLDVDKAVVRSFLVVAVTGPVGAGSGGPVQEVENLALQAGPTERFLRLTLVAEEVAAHHADTRAFVGMVGVLAGVGPGQLSTAADAAVWEDVLADDSVTTTKIKVGNVTAAKIADRTRSFMLTPAGAGLDGTALATAAGAVSPNFVPIIRYTDGLRQGAYWTFMVPLDWASGVITIQPVWAPSVTDTTPPSAVRWSMSARDLPAGNTIINAGTVTTWTGVDANKTLNQHVYDTATSTGVTPAAAGGLFRLELERIGGDAADTYVGNVELSGVIVTYTADS